MRISAAALMTLVLVFGTPGCAKYKSKSCTQTADCLDLPWDNQDCAEGDGWWLCHEGKCWATCDQNQCDTEADCEDEPWPADIGCSQGKGYWTCQRDDSLPLGGVVPGDDGVADFRQAGQTGADDEAGLYSQINGAAAGLIDAGWQQGLFVDYLDSLDTGLTVSVTIHDMGSSENARAYYLSVLTDGHTELWNEDDTAAASLEVPDIYLQVDMYLAKFFIRLTMEETGADAQQAMLDFANYFRDQALQRICQAQCDP